MPDPFETLRAPLSPVDPDPAFAARLRARLQRGATLPKGVTVSETTLPPSPDASSPDLAGVLDDAAAGLVADATGSGSGSDAAVGLVPYIIVADARAALTWYTETLGARRRGTPVLMPDGRVGHAELEIGGARLFLADESPESHVAAPAPGAPATVSLVVEVAEVDAVLARAVEAGASVERPPADYPYGRNAVVRDPFGHRWMLSSPEDGASADEPDTPEVMRTGDIGYVSLWVPDMARARDFFGAVLGWSFGPALGEQGRQVVGQALHHGVWGGQARSSLFVCYVVEDLDAALIRVRDAGGESGEPTEEPYGRVATCRDDQGTPFALFTPPPGPPAARPAAHGGAHGDLAYVTLEVPDARRTRAFFGAVLGWRFTPGRVDEGWQVDDIRPMVGIHGGHDRATGVPMYRVDDIEAAVAEVRAAGGSATDPEPQPYGITASCTDDQGTRFYLGQL